MMIDQPQGLISVLLDKRAREDERHDAAMDLGFYADEKALAALILVASDPSEKFIADVAGESIAEIWVKLNFLNLADYNKLISTARYEAFAVIKKHKPEWIDFYNLKA